MPEMRADRQIKSVTRTPGCCAEKRWWKTGDVLIYYWRYDGLYEIKQIERKDCMSGKNGRNAISELAVERLMTPYLHARPRPDTSSHGGIHEQRCLGNAPAPVRGFPLVYSESGESRQIDGGKISQEDI